MGGRGTSSGRLTDVEKLCCPICGRQVEDRSLYMFKLSPNTSFFEGSQTGISGGQRLSHIVQQFENLPQQNSIFDTDLAFAVLEGHVYPLVDLVRRSDHHLKDKQTNKLTDRHGTVENYAILCLRPRYLCVHAIMGVA